MRLLERVIKDLEGIGAVEIPIRMEGRRMVLLMVPRTQATKPAEKKSAEKKSTASVSTGRAASPRAPAQAGAPSASSGTKPKP
jgi:hypothetical protein